jgi:hypothetical protein
MPRERQLELGDELFHGNNKGILEIEDKGLPPEKGDDSGVETPQQEMQDTREDTPSKEMPDQGEGEEPRRSGRNRIPKKYPVIIYMEQAPCIAKPEENP